jgi:hypothetical protein
MNVYDIEIYGLGFDSDNRMKILAKNLKEAYAIAQDMTEAAKTNWNEDCELVAVSQADVLTDPSEFKQEQIERKQRIEKEASE